MKQIFIIIKREYLQVVRKKSFAIMTILGPIILAALCIVPTVLAIYGNDTTTIAVLDESGIFRHLNSANDKDIHYEYVHEDIDYLKQQLLEKKYNAILYIPDDPIAIGGMVYSHSSLNSGVMSNILSAMKTNFTDIILISDFNIAKDSLDRYINQHTERITLGYTHIDSNGLEETKSSHTREIQLIVGIIAGLLIYIFIFMYGSTVYRSVLEEKTSRIVEIIVSSVKPIQLMIGKIIGVACIGLTQLALWVIFTFVILGVFAFLLPTNSLNNSTEILQQIQGAPNTAVLDAADWSVLSALMEIDFTQLILLFVFFFLGGYFLYASLYAAIGSSVDNETDSQQFITALTSPLFLAIIISTYVANHPDGQVAFWFSIIPFTSPIVMLTRIPAGIEIVPAWQILLSCSILILSCALCIWMAAKIYRTGILMYGKKITYKELWKWLRYKN